MKQTCALMLSLVLLMAQFAFAASPCGAEGSVTVTPARSAGHSCCAPAQPVRMACNAPCCVASNAPSDQGSAPAAPVPTPTRSMPFVAALLAALWMLPAPADLPASISAPSAGAVSAPPVPLFLRHGALLI